MKAPGPLRAFYLRIKKKRNHNVAVVAVARKLAELVWHLLTKEQDYIYSIPRLTEEKRARVRQLAQGTKTRSGPKGKPRSPLYGTGVRGRRVKTQIYDRLRNVQKRLTPGSWLTARRRKISG